MPVGFREPLAGATGRQPRVAWFRPRARSWLDVPGRRWPGTPP